MRHLPAGILGARFAWGFLIVALVLLFAARALNPLCLKLAPVALAVVFFYSYTKRFTVFSHLVLGFRWASRLRQPGSRSRVRWIRAFSGSPRP